MANIDALRPYSPRKSSMTFWSRHDPVKLPQGYTDHWTKMHAKCTTFQVAMPSGKVISHGGLLAQRAPKTEQVATFEYTSNGTLKRVGDPTFTQVVVSGLNGTLPGNYDRKRQVPGSARSLRTSFNDKAREGFNYWQIDRPKPTKFGRCGIGSANTILGLGNSIRT
ncbi:uncharacterized protein LOC119737701 [Patiria miniata]|uniref:Uncharacterized protein n=1 Tax=Patiria miniata TaxID=46514 RepID=A0A914AXC4_PATMI|nr:uncharacterized protein LOC119737701 [Patiria miniata]